MESARIQTAAWWIWVGGQAAIVALYASQVKLSGAYPMPVEATADLGLAVGQLVLGTLLARALLPTGRAASLAAAPAVVFTVLAGQLAGQTISDAAVLFAVVCVWLAVAGVWSFASTPRLALAFLTLGGPILFYVSLEYGSAPTSLHSWAWAASPVLGVCSTRLHGTLWPTLLIALAIFTVGSWARRARRGAETLYCNVSKTDE
ncbi:MAG: hypothetical protein JWM57_2316 [Phycisphaerales bacterium]|nr:hypothetical protein [Phycisphaerales bacterium]